VGGSYGLPVIDHRQRLDLAVLFQHSRGVFPVGFGLVAPRRENVATDEPFRHVAVADEPVTGADALISIGVAAFRAAAEVVFGVDGIGGLAGIGHHLFSVDVGVTMKLRNFGAGGQAAVTWLHGCAALAESCSDAGGVLGGGRAKTVEPLLVLSCPSLNLGVPGRFIRGGVEEDSPVDEGAYDGAVVVLAD